MAEIDEVVAQFASGAAMLAEAGFDAVELHFGHHYLVSAFLSPRWNRRTDDYGGRPANRARLPVQILRAVRNATGGRIAVTAFTVIFVAEWGDLTQLLTANLAAHYHDPLSVATGAVLALWTASAIAVTSGRWLSSVIDAFAIRIGTAVLLAGLGAYTAWEALR